MKAVKQFFKNPKQVRKALVCLVACVMLAVAQGVLPHQVAVYVQVLQPLLVTYGVWRVPNEDEEKPAEAPQSLPPSTPQQLF